jgi:holo-[acyl-carrier protein] synthase
VLILSKIKELKIQSKIISLKIEFTALMNLNYLVIQKIKLDISQKDLPAKEAFAKALGTGFRDNLNFKDIEIMNDKLGKPYYAKTKKITQIIKKEFKVKNFQLFFIYFR